MKLKMTIAELHDFNRRHFPQTGGRFSVLELDPGTITVRMRIDENHLRPGGTVSGPSMFALADICFYLVTLSLIGPEALTVTTNCSIDFLRKPAPGDLIGKARVLKLGKTLSVGDVVITSQGSEDAVAHANLTYSIPPNRQK